MDAFDKQAEYYTSLKTFVPQWLDEIANQTVTSTLALLDIFDDLRSVLGPIVRGDNGTGTSADTSGPLGAAGTARDADCTVAEARAYPNGSGNGGVHGGVPAQVGT